MRGIIRKAVADIVSRPLQSVLLFLVVAAAAATLSLALNVQSSAAKPYERLREQSNGADLWINTFGGTFDFEALKREPGVKAVSGPNPVSYTSYGISNGKRKQQFALVGMGPQLPEVDHPVLTDGRWLSSSGANEIVIDRGAARRLDIRVGQQVDLLTPSGPRPFTVVGFAVPTSRAPAPINDPAWGYVLPETLQRLEPNAVFGASLEHRLHAGVQLEPGATFDLRRGGGSIAERFGVQTAENVKANIKEANTFDVIFLNVFSVFALFAAGLIIANTVGGQVLSQLRDTGILKAIGFTPGQITLALLLQNLALSLAASLVGVLAGLLVAPFFLERSADILGVPAAAAFNPALLSIALLVVVVLVALFTLVPAWRAGRVPAIAALNAGADLGTGRASGLAAFLTRIGMPRVAAVGVKDLFRRPVRTFMTVAALVLAVVTATFSLGIEATFNKTMSDPTVIGGPPYDIAADRDLLPDQTARGILDARPEVASYLVTYDTGGRIGNLGFELRGIEGDLNNPRWAVREGRMPIRGGEAAVSTTLANQFGLNVGDRANVELAGETERFIDVQIVGRYVDIEGETMIVTRDALPPDVTPTDYLIRTVPGTNNRQLANAFVAASGGYLDPEVLDESIAEIRDQFRSVLIGLNAVLFVIAGLNLLASLLLSIRERRRDFAILKTVGFTPGQVAQSVFAGSTALATIALITGLPLGLIATRLMFDALSSAAGIGTGVGEMPGLLWLAPLVPAAIIIAALATALPARRAAGVQVAEALRYE
jgi:putative ABC transport system permease protein